MQIQFGKTKIEINGGFMYIQAFGREAFVKREGGQPFSPYMRIDANSGAREIWGCGLYAVLF
jgi:hypothetical protein